MQPAPRADRTITIGGLPGTGTTTACARLKDVTGLPYVYAGQIFRDMAKAHDMSLEQFGRFCESHPEMDRQLDARQLELLRGPALLLEGRMSAVLAHREGLAVYKVWFTCDPWVRAERIVEREGGDVEDRMAEMRRREESEKKRYWEYYQYDTGDLSVYDLVLDTTKLDPDGVVEAVVQGYAAPAQPPKRWFEFWK